MDKRLASLKKDVRGGFDWGEVEKLMEGEYEEEGWGRVMGRLLDNIKDIDDDEVGLGGSHFRIADRRVVGSSRTKIRVGGCADGPRRTMTRNRRGTRTLATPNTMRPTRVTWRAARWHMTTMPSRRTLTRGRSIWCVVEGAGANQNYSGTALMWPFQDADFIDEPAPKKSKKDKKGKGKHRDDNADGVDDEAEADGDLTVVEKADKIKRAVAEYKALDHEDMVGPPRRFNCMVTVRLGMSWLTARRLATCLLVSSMPVLPRPPSASHPSRSSSRRIPNSTRLLLSSTSRRIARAGWAWRAKDSARG
jgi:hypothetical protein